jgi:hypothetical protein
MLGYDLERVPLDVRRQMSVSRQNLLIGEFLRNVREPAQLLPDGDHQLICWAGVQVRGDPCVDTTTDPGDLLRCSNTVITAAIGKRLSDSPYVRPHVRTVLRGGTVTDTYIAGNMLPVELRSLSQLGPFRGFGYELIQRGLE